MPEGKPPLLFIYRKQCGCAPSIRFRSIRQTMIRLGNPTGRPSNTPAWRVALQYALAGEMRRRFGSSHRIAARLWCDCGTEGISLSRVSSASPRKSAISSLLQRGL
jgi:hypothetical protein